MNRLPISLSWALTVVTVTRDGRDRKGRGEKKSYVYLNSSKRGEQAEMSPIHMSALVSRPGSFFAAIKTFKCKAKNTQEGALTIMKCFL